MRLSWHHYWYKLPTLFRYMKIIVKQKDKIQPFFPYYFFVLLFFSNFAPKMKEWP